MKLWEKRIGGESDWKQNREGIKVDLTIPRRTQNINEK